MKKLTMKKSKIKDTSILSVKEKQRIIGGMDLHYCCFDLKNHPECKYMKVPC